MARMSRETIDFRKIGTDLLVAVALQVAFVLLSALVLWPFGKAVLAWQVAKGFSLFFLVVVAVVLLAALLQKLFRIEDDPPSSPFVISNLLLSACVQVGWSAFAALAIAGQAAGATMFALIVLHLVGFLSTMIAKTTTDVFFKGNLYAAVNALLTMIAYIVFAIWPVAARAAYGWFFALW